MLAAELDVRLSGKRHATNIVKELSLASPRGATRIKRTLKLFELKPKQMSPEQALAFYINANFTCNRYKILNNIGRTIELG